MRRLCPRAPGIYRFPARIPGPESELEWRLALSESRLLDRRSGRIPALPYPPSSFASIILFQLRYKEMFAEMAIDKL